MVGQDNLKRALEAECERLEQAYQEVERGKQMMEDRQKFLKQVHASGVWVCLCLGCAIVCA
jgi:hypothetical protein